MFKKVAQTLHNLMVDKGDTVTIFYTHPNGEEEKLATHEIEKEMHLTVAKIYEFENEFDLKEGIAGVIGNDE